MTDVITGWLTVGLAVAFFASSAALRRGPVFALVLLNRWLRWLLFGFGLALLMRETGLSERPYWALAPALLLVWILLESIQTWLAVRALSLSEIAVYPSYRESNEEVRWPVAKSFLRIKEDLRALGFCVEKNLSADLGAGLTMRSFLGFDEKHHVRLQVIFAPRASGAPAVFTVFTSACGEKRWVTDNVWLPFGGVFPRDWSVERRPFQTSVRALYRRHLLNLEKWKADPAPFEGDLVDVLNAEQETLDRAATETGLLVPRRERPEFGKLTGDGRYHVWKQILLLNYLGLVGGRLVQ